MSFTFKPFLLGFMGSAFLFLASGAEALGSLQLLCRTHWGKQLFSITEEEKVYSGQIREGLTWVTPVALTLKEKRLIIKIRNEPFSIDRLDLGQFISYGGVLEDRRGLSAQAEHQGSQWILSGTVENHLGRLIDFKALADEENGRLELSWGDYFLYLKKVPGSEVGKCQGHLIKKDSDQIGRFWCRTSGTLKDAFFNDPDQILVWLVAFFVKAH